MTDFSYKFSRRKRPASTAALGFRWYVTIESPDCRDYLALRRCLYNQEFSHMIAYTTSGSSSDMTAVIRDDKTAEFTDMPLPAPYEAPKPKTYPFSVEFSTEEKKELAIDKAAENGVDISMNDDYLKVSFQSLGDVFRVVS